MLYMHLFHGWNQKREVGKGLSSNRPDTQGTSMIDRRALMFLFAVLAGVILTVAVILLISS
jgi:hypothetical protein